MDGFIELVIGMWIVAIVSFAPLGYFIYVFSKNEGESFGKSEPGAHKVEDSKYYGIINNVMKTILGGTGNTDSAPSAAKIQKETKTDVSDSRSESPEPSPERPVSRGYGSMPIKR